MRITTILLIEDNSRDARFIREMFEGDGVYTTQVVHVERMSEAEKHLAEHHVDIILLDLGLPDADGQTLSVWLKGDPALSKIPIIVLTAWPEEVARQTVNAYGLNGYLCKPFTLTALVTMIDSVLDPK